MFNNYALLIGVEDYSAYDTSAGHPGGTSSVSGALNDARSFFRECLAMGISPERIRVLTSPRLKPEDLGPGAIAANIGDATRESILAGITWLEEQLGADKTPVEGLLTFSGHGLRTHGVALCPSDVDASLEKVIFLADVEGPFDRMQAAHNLTIVLDCCHAQEGVHAEARLRCRLKTEALTRPIQPHRVRVLSASEAEQSAASSTFGGSPMGAFTWALTSAMGQWRTTEEQGVVRLDASYDELVRRSKELLTALSFTQTPGFTPASYGVLPFMHPGPKAAPGETTPEPDGDRGRRQLDPGYKNFRNYALQMVVSNVTTTLAYMIVTNDVAGTFYYKENGGPTRTMAMSTRKEYWFVNPSRTAALQSAWNHSPGNGFKLHFVETQDAGGSFDWTWADVAATPYDVGSCTTHEYGEAIVPWDTVPGNAAWPPNSLPFQKQSGTTTMYALAILLNQAQTSITQVTWYQTATQNLALNNVDAPPQKTALSPQGYYAASNLTVF
jgi:hypothetical protein